MKKNALLFLAGMFAANFAAAQEREVEGFRLINLADSLKGEKLVPMDAPCGCSSVLVNIDPENREVYFNDVETLEDFARDEKFRQNLKNLTPEKAEDDMVLEKENYIRQNGETKPRMYIRMTRLGNGTGQWDTGFYRSKGAPPKKPEVQIFPEPLFF